jgi:3-hydroxyacyl-[acyl-carrier-protein] dehydratase
MAAIQAPVSTKESGLDHELTFHFGEGFIGFKGHFPGHPVLPAFVQILMGHCALEIRTGQRWALRRIERAKFMKVILPDQPVRACWTEQPRGEVLCGSFSLWVEDQKAATFTVAFTLEGGGHAQ